MENPVYCVVGLGNPGERYRNTRHNVGFAVVDWLAKRRRCHFKKQAGPFEMARFHLKKKCVILLKPLTYMNHSGEAVETVLSHYSIEPRHLLVISDDMALPLGKIRLRSRGSDGGHNGLASVIHCLKMDSFPRLRIGIDSPMIENPSDYVLAVFPESNKKLVQSSIKRASDAGIDFIRHGIVWTMNMYNG